MNSNELEERRKKHLKKLWKGSQMHRRNQLESGITKPVRKRKKRRIKKKKWYIVDSADINNPKLIRKEFESKQQAVYCIGKFLEEDFFRYDVLLGEDARAYKIKFKRGKLGIGWTKLRKYDYQDNDFSSQSKKSYRTKFRRHRRGYANRLRDIIVNDGKEIPKRSNKYYKSETSPISKKMDY